MRTAQPTELPPIDGHLPSTDLAATQAATLQTLDPAETVWCGEDSARKGPPWSCKKVVARTNKWFQKPHL